VIKEKGMEKKITGRKLPRSGTRASYTNVLLEEIRSNVSALFERFDLQDQRIGEKFEKLESELISEIKLTRDALSFRMDRITGSVDKHDEEILHLKQICT
jgi:hypothetical protein